MLDSTDRNSDPLAEKKIKSKARLADDAVTAKRRIVDIDHKIQEMLEQAVASKDDWDYLDYQESLDPYR